MRAWAAAGPTVASIGNVATLKNLAKEDEVTSTNDESTRAGLVTPQVLARRGAGLSGPLAAQGLRPIQLQVPKMHAPRFRAEAHRRSLAGSASPHNAEDQAFIDRVSVGPDGRSAARFLPSRADKDDAGARDRP